MLAALVFEAFYAGDKKSKEMDCFLRDCAVQRLVRKDGSPSQMWAEVYKMSFAQHPFMGAGWVLWLEVSKDHEGVNYHVFRNEAPKSFVVWFKMVSELLGCCSGKCRIRFYVESPSLH